MVRCILLTALLWLAGCGAPPPARPSAGEVVAVLEALPCVLDEEIFFRWMDDGISGLRRGRTAIESESPDVHALDALEVRRRLGEADVVLVADLHDHDLFRGALTRLMRTHAATSDLAQGRIGLGFEAIAPQHEDPLRDAVARRDRPALLALLRRSWPWPVEAYLDVLLDRTLAGVVPFAMGDARTCSGPGPGLADGERRPEVLLPTTVPRAESPATTLDLAPPERSLDLDDWADLKYGLSFGRKNQLAAQACVDWVGGARGRRMFVLYGAAHMLEDAAAGNGIRDLLVRAGLRVEVVVPFLVGWERALHKRFGAAALDTVYEVLPGVLRVPPDPRELLAFASSPGAVGAR